MYISQNIIHEVAQFLHFDPRKTGFTKSMLKLYPAPESQSIHDMSPCIKTDIKRLFCMHLLIENAPCCFEVFPTKNQCYDEFSKVIRLKRLSP